jgi:hypothetical protein
MIQAPIYTTLDNVKIRLVNKVQFQQDPDLVQDGEVSDLFLLQLISDAETAVEQDLRGRYKIPFQSIRTKRWLDLPDHSQRAIRRAIDLKCVMEVLSPDFGRGTHVSAEGYYKTAKESYESYINSLLGRDPEGANAKHDRFRFTPPLEDVALSLSNSKADDGFKGRIINTDASERDSVTYAEDQINDPSKTYVTRRTINPAEG